MVRGGVPIVAALVLIASCARSRAYPAPIPALEAKPRTAFALHVVDIRVGAGAVVGARQCVFAHYTGWLANGTKFDSSRDTLPNGQSRPPIAFPLGVRRVIAGWDLGFEGMRVGGQRRLIIPYQLGYGETGRPPSIPPKSELIFDVEVMNVADTLPTGVSSSVPTARADSAPRRAPTTGPQCPQVLSR
jgi:peptidylprolyl isomerase